MEGRGSQSHVTNRKPSKHESYVLTLQILGSIQQLLHIGNRRSISVESADCRSSHWGECTYFGICTSPPPPPPHTHQGSSQVKIVGCGHEKQLPRIPFFTFQYCLGEVCVGPCMGARGFPADLNSHLTDSRLPSRAHEKSIELSTGQTCKKAPLPAQQGVVLSCRFAKSKVRWTSSVLWMAVVSQSSVKSSGRNSGSSHVGCNTQFPNYRRSRTNLFFQCCLATLNATYGANPRLCPRQMCLYEPYYNGVQAVLVLVSNNPN